MTWEQVYVKAEREVLAEADTSRGRRDGLSCHGFSVERFHQSHYGSVSEHYFYLFYFFFYLELSLLLKPHWAALPSLSP